MSKPRIAIFDFACCEGCQLQIVNMEEEILDLLSVITPVEWREAISDSSDEYDIAIIEGSITRHEDEERIKVIRGRAGILIALGACATIGGVNKIKNNFTVEDVTQYVYGKDAGSPHLETYAVKSVADVVRVDYEVHGCPIDASELAYVVKCLLAGRKPSTPTYPVCVECKMRENGCRYEYGEVCLGPITRAGCGARCPSNGFWCFGCRGTLDHANVEGARSAMKQYGRTLEDLQSKMLLFGTRQEAANV